MLLLHSLLDLYVSAHLFLLLPYGYVSIKALVFYRQCMDWKQFTPEGSYEQSTLSITFSVTTYLISASDR